MAELIIKTEDIYRCLLDECADGIVITDSKGAIVSINAAMARLTGKTSEKLAGEPLKVIVDLDRDTLESTPVGMKALGGNGGPGSAPSAVADSEGGGGPTPAAGTPRPAVVFGRSGAELVMPVSHISITDNEEKGKKKSNPKGFLTVVYVMQSNSVQQAQTDFVSTVSHELRTPLTSIKGFADTILRAGDRLDASQQRRYIGIIKDQADRLTRLVEDLLAVSRLESKKLQLTIRAIDLENAIERVVQNLSEKAGDHKINVETPPGLPPVWADADRLEQILTNLIDNAIKYSPPRTTVRVVAKTVQTDGQEWVEFSVTDQGGGIPQEAIPKIFVKFSRLDNPLVRQTEGTGLGLYITRSLVLALGGDITVTSSQAGTTFIVRLPAANYEQQAQRGRDQS